MEKSRVEHEAQKGKAKSDEEVVLDYVKKMSLAEQQQKAALFVEGKMKEAQDPSRTAEQHVEIPPLCVESLLHFWCVRRNFPVWRIDDH